MRSDAFIIVNPVFGTLEPEHHDKIFIKSSISLKSLKVTLDVTPVAGLIFETKNRAIFLERFFGREITAREQLSRAKNSLDFM